MEGYGEDMLMEQVLNKHNEQKLIKRLKGLPPKQLNEVIQFIDFIIERHQEETAAGKAHDLKKSILDLRGRGRGEQLVEKLLRSRREDQMHDERK